MLMIYLIILFIVLNIVEAKLQSVILKDYTKYVPPNIEDQRRYHLWFVIYYLAIIIPIIIIASLSIGWIGLILIPTSLLTRRLFFQETLNIFRGLKFGYLSDRGIDKIEKNIFGKDAGKINAVLCLVGILLSILYIYIQK